jgi:hypothetical protein
MPANTEAAVEGVKDGNNRTAEAGVYGHFSLTLRASKPWLPLSDGVAQ